MIGVGVIGFEFGLVWCCLGLEVVVFEVLDIFLLMVDKVLVKDY